MKEQSHSEQQAQANLESIIEMVENLKAMDDTNSPEYEDAQQAIQDSVLEVTVRSGWYVPGASDTKPAEFNILLCTGGPAVRIIGALSVYGVPESAWLEHQDWGTPWTRLEHSTAGPQNEALLEYCQQFYFGE